MEEMVDFMWVKMSDIIFWNPAYIEYSHWLALEAINYSCDLYKNQMIWISIMTAIVLSTGWERGKLNDMVFTFQR